MARRARTEQTHFDAVFDEDLTDFFIEAHCTNQNLSKLNEVHDETSNAKREVVLERLIFLNTTVLINRRFARISRKHLQALLKIFQDSHKRVFNIEFTDVREEPNFINLRRGRGNNQASIIEAKAKTGDSLKMLFARATRSCLACQSFAPWLPRDRLRICKHFYANANGAFIEHPYIGDVLHHDAYGRALLRANPKLFVPFTASAHFVNIRVVRMRFEHNDEFFEISVLLGQEDGNRRNEDDANYVLSALTRPGHETYRFVHRVDRDSKLYEALQRVTALRETRIADALKEYPRGDASVYENSTPASRFREAYATRFRFEFSVLLPLFRLKNDGIGVPDCSFAELFMLSDSEFRAFAALGKEVAEARELDAELTMLKRRKKLLHEQLERLWRKNVGEGRLFDYLVVPFTASWQNVLVFNTWRYGQTLTDTCSRLACNRALDVFESKRNEENIRFASSPQAACLHFNRFYQVAQTSWKTFDLDKREMEAYVVYVATVIKVARPVEAHADVRRRSLNADHVFGALLYNVLRTKEVSLSIATVFCENATNVFVRFAVASGGGLHEFSTTTVRFFAICKVGAFLEATGSVWRGDDHLEDSSCSGTLPMQVCEMLHRLEDDTRALHRNELIEIKQVLSGVAETVTRQLSMAGTFDRIDFLSTLLCSKKFYDFHLTAPRAGAHVFCKSNQYYEEDIRPFCEFMKFKTCMCQSGCTFTGRTCKQPVFGSGNAAMTQLPLSF